MQHGKIWGKTQEIFKNNVLEFHRIEFKQGYKCSEHEHQFKWNGFYCERGELLIRVWQNHVQARFLIDETILKPGDFTMVKPGMVHQFEGLSVGVAFELYFAEFSHDDIIRKSVGCQVIEETINEFKKH